MTFAQKLQAFIDELVASGDRFTPIEMIIALTTQTAACVAVSTLATGENPKTLLDTIDTITRMRTEQCMRLDQKRRN